MYVRARYIDGRCGNAVAWRHLEVRRRKSTYDIYLSFFIYSLLIQQAMSVCHWQQTHTFTWYLPQKCAAKSTERTRLETASSKKPKRTKTDRAGLCPIEWERWNRFARKLVTIGRLLYIYTLEEIVVELRSPQRLESKTYNFGRFISQTIPLFNLGFELLTIPNSSWLPARNSGVITT